MRWLPEVDRAGLWPDQVEAIAALERSFMEKRPCTLIQMATGAGKTFTAANVFPASEARDLWIYDLRTNMHFTRKTNPLRLEDREDFVRAYRPGARHERTESDRFRTFSYDELLARDKVSLDVFWLRDESLEGSASLPPPETIAQEIVENLEAALSEVAEFATTLRGQEQAD